MVFVSRERKSQRNQALEAIKARVLNPLTDEFSSPEHPKTWPQVLLFPEGTTTNAKSLIQFKAGSFRAGTPVQPIVIRRDKNKWDTLTWTKGCSFIASFWSTICQFNTKIEIEFLPVYTPNVEEVKDPIQYANNVRDKMAMSLDIPTYDKSGY